MQDLEVSFKSAFWQPAVSVKRPFVRYPNKEASPGYAWRYSSENNQINLSVVIPTSDAYRGGYFLKLLSQIGCQDYSNFELIVVRGDPRQGRAINTGASLAQGIYLLTLDDDTSLPDTKTFSKLVAVMEVHPEIGIGGGNNIIPSDASPFVRRVMQQIPRRSWLAVQTITDSDLAEHPCMIMRKNEFEAMGGENELIPRGLDPYLRQEFRKLGKRVVVVPGVSYHHLPPDSLNKLLKQSFRNGRQAAYVNRNYPQWVIETPNKHGTFVLRRTLWLRIPRYPLRLISTLVTGRWMWFIYQIFYASGFVFFWLTNIWKSPTNRG
ncbi:MAG: glycosyltransferase [Candidatus Aminicenantes bacterium]|nr:MAG: glycosyltransferase [Candidatus Aminicenantes bacterium]